MSFDPTILVVDELAAWLQTVNLADITSTTRREALEQLRHHVGRRIFVARQPDRSPDLTLTLTKTGGRVESGLTGLITLRETTIEAQCFARSEDGHRAVQIAQECLLWSLAGYTGVMGRLTIRQIQQEGDQVFVGPPRDAAAWEHDSTANYVIQYVDPNHA